MKVTFLGHSSFLINFSDKTVLIDPFFSNAQSGTIKFKAQSGTAKFKRLLPCSMKLADLKEVTLILITHKHFDHFNKKEVEKIASRFNAIVVAHSDVLQDLELSNALKHPVTAGEEFVLRGVKITVLSAHHPQDFYPVSYLLEFNKQKVFHAGDTSLMDTFSKLQKEKIDMALLPIGGTFTMDVIDAVRATKVIKPKYVIPMHYNTFKEIIVDPRDFEDKIKDSILNTKTIILKPGGKIEIK